MLVRFSSVTTTDHRGQQWTSSCYFPVLTSVKWLKSDFLCFTSNLWHFSFSIFLDRRLVCLFFSFFCFHHHVSLHMFNALSFSYFSELHFIFHNVSEFLNSICCFSCSSYLFPIFTPILFPLCPSAFYLSLFPPSYFSPPAPPSLSASVSTPALTSKLRPWKRLLSAIKTCDIETSATIFGSHFFFF